MKTKDFQNALKKWLQSHEKQLLPALLLFGVAADYLTFKTISFDSAFILLGIYLLLAGLAIGWQNWPVKFDLAWQQKISRFAPYLQQFTLGALLSAVLLFYWFSGSPAVSWPIFIILAGLMIGNEILREYYFRLLTQVSLYYFVLFSYLAVIFPFLFHSLSVWLFIGSGLASLALMAIYLFGLGRLNAETRRLRPQFSILIALIFAVLNVLYFMNLIPPLPLSLRQAEIFHAVSRNGPEYVVQTEDISWFDRLWPGQTALLAPGERLYVFTSIFSPADLSAQIIHHWQFYDPVKRRWESRDRISFPIAGGRQNGYRGYSYKTALASGRWRVDIETPRGQIIGRVNFKVEIVGANLPLHQEFR